MFTLDLQITKKAWLSNPPERWNAGLEGAGLNFRQSLQPGQYPPQKNPGGYVRKGNAGGLASKANFHITKVGKEMTFGSMFYLKFLLFGTGIYGPTGSPITPRSAPMLAWRGAGGQWIFAKSVQGTIWEGKKEQIATVMQAGFKQGVHDFHG